MPFQPTISPKLDYYEEAASPLTTKGDLYTYDTTNARLGVGSNGQLLQADSTQTTGLKWTTVAGAGDVTAAANLGDNLLIRGDGAGKGVQNSGITIDDSDNMTGMGTGHDIFTDFVANEHIDHTTVTLTAGDGLSGGGDISANRTFTVNVDDATIEIDTDSLRVKANGINDSHIDWGVGANQVSAVDVPIADAGSYYAGTEVETALQESGQQASVHNLNGFEDASTVALSTDSGTPPTYTLTFTGTVAWWSDGVRYTDTGTDAIQISDVNGPHVIYYDGATLSEIANPNHQEIDDIIEDKAIAMWVYWNTNDNSESIIADELHGAVMSGSTHHYLHDTQGAKYEDGGTISAYTLGTASDVAISFDITNIDFYDEDKEVNIIDGLASTQYSQVLTGDAEVPVLYRDATDQSWTEQAASTLPYIVGGNTRIEYMDKASSYALKEVGVSNFCSYWLVATNDWQTPIKMVPGDQEYSSANDARNNAQEEVLDLGDLPSAEFIFLYQFVMRHRNGGTKNAKIISIIDLRAQNISGSAANPATDHGGLSGLADDDHTQYLLASQATDRATFSTNWTDLTDAGATTLHTHAFTSSADTPAAYVLAQSIYRVNSAGDAVEESGVTVGRPSGTSFTLDRGGTTLTVTADCTIDQNLQTSASPTFAGLALGAGSLTLTGSIATTGSRVTKGWFTDLEVTNAIAGSITGNAATVTGLTLNGETLTLTTGALTLTPNADDSSVLTIGAGAVSVSGTNTGDNTVCTSGAATTAETLKTARTIAGVSFDGSANISLNNNAITNGAGYTTNTGDMILGSAQSNTGVKTFNKGTLKVKGTSTGVTDLTTANTSATSYTATFPAKTGTVAMTSDITGTNSNTNTGDQTSMSGISDTKANFNTSCSDGTFLYVGDAPTAHAASHAVSAADTIFPADPGADRFLMWDDDPGELVWAAGGGGTDLTGLGTDNTIAKWDGTDTLQDTGITIDDSENVSGMGTLGCNEITIANGHGLNLQEDITFTGATTENLIKMPDNLAVGLAFKEGANSYLTFITTNSGERVEIHKKVLADDGIYLVQADGAERITSDQDGYVDIYAANEIDFNIGATQQLTVELGLIKPTADNDIDLGSVGVVDHRFKNLYLAGDLSDETNSLSVAEAKTAYDHSQDNTQAHTDYLLNNANDTTSGTLTMANLIIGDAGTIGSASDTDAIAISAGGVVTLSVQGIADNQVLTVDDADAADNDFAKFTANGIEGRSYTETMADLSGGAGAAFSFNDQNITNVGSIDLDIIRADAANGTVVVELDNAAGADFIVGNNNALAVEGDNDRVAIGHVSPQTALDVDGAITLNELSADPSNPAEGTCALWLSDGTDDGEDGDVLVRKTVTSVVRTHVLRDWDLSQFSYVYVSAKAFTVTGVDVTDIFYPGRPLEIDDNGTSRFGYVQSSSFSTNTTVNLTALNASGGVVEANLSSGAINDVWVGNIVQERGHPGFLHWTPTLAVSGGTAPDYTTQFTNKFRCDGSMLSWYMIWFNASGGTAGNGAGALTLTMPVSMASEFSVTNTLAIVGNGRIFESGGTDKLTLAQQVTDADTVRFFAYDNSIISGSDQSSASRLMSMQGFYRI